MTIIDIDGKEITVTDLELAIMQADDYRHYRHVDPENKAGNQRLQVYWEDIHQKLLLLRNE